MSTVGNIGQLVAIIRAQLTTRTETNALHRPPRRRSAAKTSTYSAANLETLVGQRIQSIDRSDPDKGKKAFRIFLETLLLTHFGEHLMNDPKFHQLVDDVQMSMDTDVEVRSLIDNAIKHLLSSTGS